MKPANQTPSHRAAAPEEHNHPPGGFAPDSTASLSAGAAKKRSVPAWNRNLIVLIALVFGALVWSAVHNFRIARVNSRYRRAQTDLRSIATAALAYFVDYSDYPMWGAGPNGVNAGCPKDSISYRIPTLGLPRGATPNLTTPVSYLPSIPHDPFAPDSGACYGYHSIQYHSLIVWSPGPDGVYDLSLETIEHLVASVPQGKYDWFNWRKCHAELAKYQYDPTNGAISRGDIMYSPDR